MEFDVTSISIAIGLVVSLLFTELFGLAAGGMVVPGYLAISLDRPGCIFGTLAASVATFFVVRGISKFSIVYGRRKIVLMILFGFLIGSLTRAVPACAAVHCDMMPMPAWSVSAIGFVIPGLIALWIERQGIFETLSILLTTTVVVRCVLILFGMEAPA